MDLTELCERLVTDIDELAKCCSDRKKEEALQRTSALMGRLATFFDLIFKVEFPEIAGFEEEVVALKDKAIPAIGNAFRAVEISDLESLGNIFVGEIKICIEAIIQNASVKGRRICSKTSSEATSEWIKSFKEVSVRTVLIFGNVDAVALHELLKVLDSKSRIVVCEPLKSDYEALTGIVSDTRVTVVDFSSDPNLFRDELIKQVDYYSLARMDVCAYPIYDAAFPREYALFLRMINDNRERLLVNKNTLTRFREEGAIHVLRNIGAISSAYLVSDLKRTGLKNASVIIVSAGPSLDKNIEDLRAAKGHAFILAVDTALKYMLAKDIIPDAFVTIDPAKPMENFRDERIYGIPVIFDEQTPPELLEKHTAAKIIYNCRDYPKKLFESCGVKPGADIPSGGSVATAAFAICYGLGIKDIILIGQDLAYTGETTHAGGVVSAGINGDIGTVMIEGIDGEKVRTRSDWLGYLRWFEHAIELIAQEAPDVRVIDATEGGALIHGTQVMTLKEVIEETCRVTDFSFEKVLEEIEPALSDGQRQKFVSLHKEEIKGLPVLLEDGKKGLELCDKIADMIKKMLLNNYKIVGGISANKGRIEGKSSIGGLDNLPAEVKSLAEKMGQIRNRCESRLIFPVINNYAVTFEAEEISRILGQKAAANSDTARFFFDIEASKVAFRGVVEACEFLLKNYHTDN